ncbi:MAG: (d)CMP kinase [Candidatus Levyibacteriota bacterium]
MKNKNFTVAIDGPVGSGKGTLAVALSKKLNALYIYTGGMYRALTLKCMREGVDIRSEEEVLKVLGSTVIELGPTEYVTKVMLDGKDVSSEIFSQEVAKHTPIVASHERVRKEMVARQKELIEDATAIVEGRDIASDVSPDADLKIYLTADLETRAKRRLAQFQKRGVGLSLDEVKKEVLERDRKDMERQASPLTVAGDAVVIDTTNDTIEQTVEKVESKLREKGLI